MNAGIGGDRAENLLYRIENAYLPETLKAISIAVGTNNLVINTEKEITNLIQQYAESIEKKERK